MRTAVLTISTSVARREAEDESGPLLAQLAEEAGADVEAMEVVPDDLALIEDRLHHYVDDDFALVFTTGGTGLTPDDVTPEATRAVIERDAPGIAEAMRAESLRHTPMGMLSRGVAGIADRTLIVNFPGSPKAIDQLFPVLAPVLRHAAETLCATVAAPPAAIELDGLTRRYGERVALAGVTLTLPAGTTLVVFGPNGAGKSTLLRVLATLLRPHAGAVRVLGRALPATAGRCAGASGCSATSRCCTATSRAARTCASTRACTASASSASTSCSSASACACAPTTACTRYSRGMVQRVAVCRAVLHDPERAAARRAAREPRPGRAPTSSSR